MAKKVLNKRKSENLSVIECVERLAMACPREEDLVLLSMDTDTAEGKDEFHKFVEQQVSKSVTTNNNIINLKEGSFMNKKNVKTNNSQSEVAITTATNITPEASAILKKISVVNVDLSKAGSRELSDVLGKYAREINSAVREINSSVIAHCKALSDYSQKDMLFSEITTEYLSNFDNELLEVLVIQLLASVGEKHDNIASDSKKKLIDSAIALYNISFELARKQFMATSVPSAKTLALFNKLNDAVPVALQFPEPTNALQANSYIEKLIDTPTTAMLNKAFKLAVENGQDLPMDKLQKQSRKAISNLIDAFEDLVPAEQWQLDALASVLKKLGEPYVATEYDKLSKAKCIRLTNSKKQELVVLVSKGLYTLEQARKLDYNKVNSILDAYNTEEKCKYFDNDLRERLSSALSNLI